MNQNDSFCGNPPARRGKKRRFEDLYNSDNEEETFSISPTTEKKLHMDDDDQTDDANATFDSKEDDGNLFDMVLELAKMDFSGEQKEPCPICLQNFTMEDFATHVIACVDEMEKKNPKVDENLAKSLDQSASITTKFEKPEFCSAGSRCKRTDARHFMSLKHPKVQCPICDDSHEVYELEAHVLMCLEKPPSQIQREKSAPEAMEDTANSDASPATSLRSFSDTIRKPLSLPQAASMARILVSEKNKSASEREVDLSDLLSSFNKLGFSDFVKGNMSGSNH